jgi:hypothetical protein
VYLSNHRSLGTTRQGPPTPNISFPTGAGVRGFAAGAGGKVYERQSAGQWNRIQAHSESQLNGATSGEGYAVAVGAGSTIVERIDGESGSTNGTNTTGTNITSTNTTMNETADLSSAGGAFVVAVDPTMVDKVVKGTGSNPMITNSYTRQHGHLLSRSLLIDDGALKRPDDNRVPRYQLVDNSSALDDGR